jgi:hypothetical protein
MRCLKGCYVVHNSAEFDAKRVKPEEWFNCDEGDGADDELDHLLMQSILENDVRIEQLCL